MKTVNLTALFAGQASPPVAIDLLAACPGCEFVVMAPRIQAPATCWRGHSDILLIDEDMISRDGAAAVHAIHACYPTLRKLLLADHDQYECVGRRSRRAYTG